ncbi:DUF5677 domain-containing protein [Peribacillus sp. FSL M8-0224]|uniref:DUF5677 domain-containing protein n=1 Tax=Peribacillus sp. FSL M8-0224 TaxID=2921568 RepID=UPI0030F55958|nr:hypothetical protein KY492_17580 [Brevibacterium sp. PAMC21349]
MGKKEYAGMIKGILNDPEYKVSVIENLSDLSTEIIKGMHYNDNYKSRALNMLFVDAYKTFESFILLMENRQVNSSTILMRKIIEILIRMEYLSISNQFENYCRSKSNDQAKILSSLLSSRPVKYVTKTSLWRERYQIIAECKKIYSDKQNGKYLEMPNLDKMAEYSGLYILYIEKYSPLSKFVHSNISIENFYLFKDEEGLHYSKETDEVINNEDRVQIMLDDTMYCFYKIIKRYIEEIKVKEIQLKKFEEKFFIFASLDLITGNIKTNVDITKNIIRNLTGEGLPTDPEDEKYEVLFLEDNLETLRHDWTKLERLVKEKEKELNIRK